MTTVAHSADQPSVRPLGAPGMPALDGLKVVEFAHLIAGPLAGSLMADLGAEVVHVEDPGSGDGARYTGPAHDGEYPWWTVAGRNKRSVTLNLRLAAARELATELIRWADVMITNFRPVALERWGLDWPSVHAISPRLVMFQASANGSNTSARNDPGFGKIGEARSGVVTLTGDPDGPPMHVGFPQADASTALMGAFAIAAALVNRDEPDFRGEWIDAALFEGLFRMADWQVVVHDQLGIVPTRGSMLGVGPQRCGPYLTEDGHWVTVQYESPAGTASVRALLDCEDSDPERLEAELTAWISRRSADQVIRALSAEDIPCGPVMTTAEMVDDDVYRWRQNIITVSDPHYGPVRMQGVVPRLSERPGRVWRTAPTVGQDNDLVYGSWLGRSPHDLDALREGGVI